jgi:hypothetical protein
MCCVIASHACSHLVEAGTKMPPALSFLRGGTTPVTEIRRSSSSSGESRPSMLQIQVAMLYAFQIGLPSSCIFTEKLHLHIVVVVCRIMQPKSIR